MNYRNQVEADDLTDFLRFLKQEFGINLAKTIDGMESSNFQ